MVTKTELVNYLREKQIDIIAYSSLVPYLHGDTKMVKTVKKQKNYKRLVRVKIHHLSSYQLNTM